LKTRSLKRCGKCGFIPASPEESAKSLMLSECFDLGEEVVGLTKPELRRASEALNAGGAYHFDPVQVSRVAVTCHQAKSITAYQLLVDGVKWLWAPVLLLILAYVIIRASH
jgi:hypothetical protein